MFRDAGDGSGRGIFMIPGVAGRPDVESTKEKERNFVLHSCSGCSLQRVVDATALEVG
jgi:hypothetical protein